MAASPSKTRIATAQRNLILRTAEQVSKLTGLPVTRIRQTKAHQRAAVVGRAVISAPAARASNGECFVYVQARSSRGELLKFGEATPERIANEVA